MRDELGRELLDAGRARDAFAVADHQVAHVYVRRPERVAEVQRAARAARRRRARARRARASARTGSIIRARASWSRVAAPTAGSPTTTGSTTRARPTSRAPSTSTASPATTRSSCSSIPTLAAPGAQDRHDSSRKKTLGFRTLMDVIPLDASLVKGSHGRPTSDADGPCSSAASLRFWHSRRRPSQPPT